jgi:hypothetical protein
LSRVEIVVFPVKFVETHLDSGTAGKFLFNRTGVGRIFPSSIVLTLNLIFVGLYELSNHIPQQMHLVGLAGRHWHSKIFKFIFSFFELLTDFSDDFREVVFDVGEKNL